MFVAFDPQEKMRQECINELINTEKAYLEDMTIVNNIFEKPLRKSEVITKEEVDGIFVNWQEIIQCNKKFLEDLLERTNSGSHIIGDIICTHLPRMTGYVTFCSNQLEGAALLQRLTESSLAFKDVVKKCQSHPATKGMPLSSFLIKPMQRITKYPLLISKILENTPSDHPDYNYLCEAQKKADRFCKHLNEGVRLKENSERLEWLQSHVNCDDLKIKFNSNTNCLGQRKLLHHGVLHKLKSGKELIGFLLNDFLLLVLPNKPLGSKQFNFQYNHNWTFKMYKQPMFIHELQFSKGNTENVENGTDMNRLLKVQDKMLLMQLLVPTANECNLWIKRLTDARDEYNKVQTQNKHTLKNIYSEHNIPAISLTITSIKGIEITSVKKTSLKRGKMYNDNIFCKISMGEQEQVTDVCKNNSQNGNIPHNGTPSISYLMWNASMQFFVKNINEDNLVIVVYEKGLFTPDEFLGRAEVKVKDIINQSRNTNGPLLKRLILHQVESGEVELKLDLQMFEN